MAKATEIKYSPVVQKTAVPVFDASAYVPSALTSMQNNYGEYVPDPIAKPAFGSTNISYSPNIGVSKQSQGAEIPYVPETPQSMQYAPVGVQGAPSILVPTTAQAVTNYINKTSAQDIANKPKEYAGLSNGFGARLQAILNGGQEQQAPISPMSGAFEGKESWQHQNPSASGMAMSFNDDAFMKGMGMSPQEYQNFKNKVQTQGVDPSAIEDWIARGWVNAPQRTYDAQVAASQAQQSDNTPDYSSDYGGSGDYSGYSDSGNSGDSGGSGDSTPVGKGLEYVPSEPSKFRQAIESIMPYVSPAYNVGKAASNNSGNIYDAISNIGARIIDRK